MRVYVYWNLNRNCYSVRAEQGPRKGRVIAHCREIEFHNVTFAVGAIGRLKSIVGPKRVHAGMRGELASYTPDPSATKTLRAITYNPLKHACFITRDNCLPNYSASHVIGLSTTDNRAGVLVRAEITRRDTRLDNKIDILSRALVIKLGGTVVAAVAAAPTIGHFWTAAAPHVGGG